MQQSPFCILIVDAHTDEATAIIEALKPEPYHVYRAATAASALGLLRTCHPDLVLCDWSLPDASGLELCAQIKALAPHTLVMFIAESRAETDKVMALDAGGEDYLTKPLPLRELRSRVRVLLRHLVRDVQPGVGTHLRYGQLEISLERRRVWWAGHDVYLTPKEFDLLVMLAQQPGRTFSRQAILDRVWAHDMHVGERIVDNYIRSLRHKMTLDPKAPLGLETVRGFGYRLRYVPLTAVGSAKKA